MWVSLGGMSLVAGGPPPRVSAPEAGRWLGWGLIQSTSLSELLQQWNHREMMRSGFHLLAPIPLSLHSLEAPGPPSLLSLKAPGPRAYTPRGPSPPVSALP